MALLRGGRGIIKVKCNFQRSAGEDNSNDSRKGSMPGTPPVMNSALSKSFNSVSKSKEDVLWLIRTCGRCINSRYA